MSSYLHDLDLDRIPSHVAIVMDGNGRWAEQRGLPQDRGTRRRGGGSVGHGAGRGRGRRPMAHRVRVLHRERRRPPGEVRYLMNFNRSLLRRRRDELHRMNVRIRFIGRRNWRVPRSVLKEIRAAEELTASNTGTTLSIAFNYGGRAEIVDAVKDLAREVRAGTLRPDRITEDTIAERLYAADMPPPDLLIRTSGEQRISNFLVWEVAYSELWFTPVFWPDFDRELLYEAIRDFQKRSRRFGGVADEP